MVKNVKKWPKIANNYKISEITKYGEKMRTNEKNSQKCKKKMPKTSQKRPKNGQIKKTKFHRFLARNYLK